MGAPMGGQVMGGNPMMQMGNPGMMGGFNTNVAAAPSNFVMNPGSGMTSNPLKIPDFIKDPKNTQQTQQSQQPSRGPVNPNALDSLFDANTFSMGEVKPNPQGYQPSSQDSQPGRSNNLFSQGVQQAQA